MSMGGGRRGSRVSGGDFAAQRAANAEAPRIPNLLPRIAELFRPHRTPLAITIALVLVSAALSVILRPPVWVYLKDPTRQIAPNDRSPKPN